MIERGLAVMAKTKRGIMITITITITSMGRMALVGLERKGKRRGGMLMRVSPKRREG